MTSNKGDHFQNLGIELFAILGQRIRSLTLFHTAQSSVNRMGPNDLFNSQNFLGWEFKEPLAHLFIGIGLQGSLGLVIEGATHLLFQIQHPSLDGTLTDNCIGQGYIFLLCTDHGRNSDSVILFHEVYTVN